MSPNQLSHLNFLLRLESRQLVTVVRPQLSTPKTSFSFLKPNQLKTTFFLVKTILLQTNATSLIVSPSPPYF
jgi:hypothetical protein